MSSVQAPVLIDLCAAYIMTNELNKAVAVCNKAAGSKWYSSLAYNNRGVLNIALGRYEEAVSDFERALRAGGSQAIAQRNLARAQERLAAIRRSREEQPAMVAKVAAPDNVAPSMAALTAEEHLAE